MQHIAIEQCQIGLICVTERPRSLHDQFENRLWIAGRGRHRLQHVDGGGLMLDPLAEFAVALASSAVRAASSSASAAFSRQRRVELCRNAAMMR